MKKTLLICCSLLGLFACKKVQDDWGTSDDKNNTMNIVGTYKGSYMECGKLACTYTDTTFSIIEKDGKKYLHFGTIEEEVSVLYSNTIRSSNVYWTDSSHNSGGFGVTGNFGKDSVHLCFSSKYITNPDIYKNSLDGKKE